MLNNVAFPKQITSDEFIHWLEGYIDGHTTVDTLRITEKLKNVTRSQPIQWPWTLNPGVGNPPASPIQPQIWWTANSNLNNIPCGLNTPLSSSINLPFVGGISHY